jgi:hypothetical protein
MQRWNMSGVVIALLALICLSVVVPCFADGDGTLEEPGDPVEELPCSKTLDPTAGILSDFWMILMAMAFQLAL